MRTWKQFIFVAVIAIFGIIAFIGCDNGDNNNDTPEQFGTVNGIPIYKEADVTSTQAQTGADNARAGYNAMQDWKANVSPTKVSKIILVASENSCTPDPENTGKYIIKIAHSQTSTQMCSRLESYGADQLAD